MSEQIYIQMASNITDQPPMEMPSFYKDGGTKVELGSAGDFDDARLTEMGYRPELDRKFSLLSCLAVGFSVSLHPAPEPAVVDNESGNAY